MPITRCTQATSATLSCLIPSFHRNLYINGTWLRGRGNELTTINPATEHVITKVDTASREDVDVAVKAARLCFERDWGTNVSSIERGRLLFKFADQIEHSTLELATLESLDSGKPISWCKADVAEAVACMRYYAGAADKIQGSTIEIDDRSKYASVRKEPIGVCAQIVPWNYPLLMAAWKFAPALAAGCSIIFKPAENTTLSMLKVAEIFDTVGYPIGSFNLVQGFGNVTGQAMAEHMDIDKIAFTGSTLVGRSIAIAAAQSNLKIVTLELGGKSPNIIFPSANLNEAAKWAALGIFENAGQSCTAGSRILIHESIYEEFITLFIKATQASKIGDPLHEATFQGSQISKDQFDRIMNYISIAKQQGAKLECGGERFGHRGFFIQPTVLSQVSQDMTIAKEEVFGPVACLMKFKSESEAVTLANSTSYGLAAAIHSNDARQIHRVTRKLKAGTIWVNQYAILQNQVPFGGKVLSFLLSLSTQIIDDQETGYKQSGWGRELGLQGLEAYFSSKAVHHYYGTSLEWPIVV